MSREMRHSGIEWIGEIPKEWKTCYTSSLFHEHKEKNIGLKNTNLLSLSYGKIKQKDINTNEGLLPQSFETYNVIRKGDIVFRLTDLQNDKRSLRTGLCKEDGIITSAYVTLRANAEVDSAYFHFLFHSYDECKVFYGLGDGVRQGMNWADVRKLSVLVPPLSEQQKIANYLDKVCGEVDEMIALQEQMIEELKAYKQSVITEAVTKGLNPDVPMKESGIDWIGEVPEHWEVAKLKYYIKVDSGDAITNEQLEVTGLYPVYGGGEIMGYYSSFNTDDEALIVGRVGARCGCVTLTEGKSWATDNALIVKTDWLLKYVFYLLQGANLNRLNTSNAQPLITATKIKNVYVPILESDEQQSIASYLDTKCAEIDALIDIKQAKIDELKDYKKSVIYEYVTGKKEVV